MGLAAICGLIATLVLYCSSEARNQYKIQEGLGLNGRRYRKDKPPRCDSQRGDFHWRTPIRALAALVAQFGNQFRDHAAPRARRALTHQPRARPRRAGRINAPAPVCRERQHHPERLAECARQVGDRCIHRHDRVETIDDRAGIREIRQAFFEAMDRLSVRMCEQDVAFLIGEKRLQHGPSRCLRAQRAARALRRARSPSRRAEAVPTT